MTCCLISVLTLGYYLDAAQDMLEVSLHPPAKMATMAAVLSANHYSYYRLLFSRNALEASAGSKISILIAYFADQLKVALERMYIMS